MSFLKYTGEVNGNGRGSVYYGRAGQDGAPFRGHGVPLLREHEFEELAERVYDAYHGTFDTSNPTMRQPPNSEHGRTLQEIIERKENGWFKLLTWNERWVKKGDEPVMDVFVVWSEPYQELPQAAAQGKISEIRHLAPEAQGRSHAGPKDSNSGSTTPLL